MINSVSRQSGADKVRLALASGLGLGLSPVAPGTCGTLLGVLIHVLSATLLPPAAQAPALAAAWLAVCAAHLVLTPWAQAHWRSSDPPHFVLDEVAGYLLVPLLFRHGPLWQVALWGFILFRIMDIVKPFPARQIDRRMQGAAGILLDDLVSGLYALLGLHGLMYVASRLRLGA